MTDRYEKIRKALEMGPTPGPWSVRYDYVVQAKSFDEGRLVPIAQPYGLRVDGIDLFANARLIAACDLDTIRVLLEERDALREALKVLVNWTPSADTYRRLGFDPETPMRAHEAAKALLLKKDTHER